MPLIERDVPIIFTHGDILPRNLILPISLDHWRATREPICIIDWETAGWMPLYWEALKATWLDHEEGTPWTNIIRDIFPECLEELDADWRWRYESNETIL